MRTLIVSVSCILITLTSSCCGIDNLRVAFQWRQLDFAFPTEEARSEAIASGEFVPANNLPLGLEVYGDRVFITVPRWRSGVPASLTYIKLTDPIHSPKLHPYPNWDAHRLSNSSDAEHPEIISPFRIRADRCGRLWVLDTGVADLLGDTKIIAPPQIIIYDLVTDVVLRRYRIPKDQVKDESFFANIAVEDHLCGDTYAYVGDLGEPALVVYSWKSKASWRIKHHFFNIDPLAGEFNVSGIAFVWTDGIFGLSLSAPSPFGHSTLYFHPLTSTNEFSVSTRVLHDPKIAKESFHEFKRLGSRGPKGQSSVSFLDPNTGVLFYALANLNAIACWRTTNPSYTMESQGRVYMSNVTMVFPNDIKVDANGSLWVLSDRLPIFMYSKLDPEDVNFRILTAPVEDAIRGTTCDSNFVMKPEIVDKLKPVIMRNVSLTQEKNVTEKSGAVKWGVAVWLGVLMVGLSRW